MRLITSKFKLSALVAIAFLFGGHAAWAQTATSSIYGDITDQQGGVIPGADVTIRNVATAVTRVTVTDERGRYQFFALPPGVYDLKAELSGFRTAVREKIELLVNTSTKLNISLQLGGLEETVTVTEAATPLNTTDASLGNVITGTQITQLPLEARNVVGLLSLQPGAVYLPTGDPRSGSVSGARSDQSNVTLDGVDVNDPQFSYAYTSVLRVTLDSVQEFRVTTSNYGAEQGRSSAAQVTLVTKSGTNEPHGSLYWYHRNTATSANEYFQKLAQLASGQPNKSPKLQKHIFGASLGGPAIKDRFFLFGNFEGLREASERPLDRSVPSASFRDGVLIYRCADAAKCPGGTVTGLRDTHPVPAGHYGLSPTQFRAIDPLGIGPSIAASNHFRQYPLPNDPGRDGLNIMGFRFAAPIKNDFITYIARADYRIDEAGNHGIFWRGNLQDDMIRGEPQFPGQPPSSTQLINNKGMALGYNWVVNPQVVNTFRYGYTRIKEETAGLRTSNAVVFRFISDLSALTSTSARTVPTHNFVDDLSWIKGNHRFQFGVNLRRTRIPRFTNANSFHTARANGSWVSGVGRTYMPGRPCPPPSTAGCGAVPAVHAGFGAVYADSLINILGIISQATARYNYNKDGSILPVGTPVTRTYASDEYEFYIQDSWKISPNLSLTYGLRYSSFSPPYETNGLQVAPSISLGKWFEERGNNAAKGIPSNAIKPFTIDVAGPVNGQKGFYEWDKNNFAPRAAFAWTPSASSGILGWLAGRERMVIRGGYATVYDRIGQALATTFDAFGSFGLSTILTSPFGVNNEDNPNIRFVNISTLPPTIRPAPKGGFPQTPPSAAGVITSSIDDTIRTPYAHVYNFALARELPGNLTVEVAYVGRSARNLLVRRDLAMPVNLVDPNSNMDYFTAARLAIRAAGGIPSTAPASAYTGIAPIAYWENLFPQAAGSGLTATQQVARRFNRDAPDYITSIWLMDQFCFPGCSKFGPFAFFNDQYDSLAGQSSIGYSEYHGMQLSARKRFSKGYQFDFNYTLAKSLDLGSAIERGGSFGNFSNGGNTGFLLNPWFPRAHYGQSDFDVRHQMNLNWVAELPFGRDRWIGKNIPSGLNQVIGGWQVSGLTRWTSGFPINVQNCRSCWPTNWNLQGNAELAEPGKLPVTRTTRNAVGGRPSPFAEPKEAIKRFRFALPGEVGLRNVLRGDGYFVIDLGVSKAWSMPWGENHRLYLRWETFNLTNTVRFDTGAVTMLPDIAASFGRYNATLASCDGAAGRCMQFALRYEF